MNACIYVIHCILNLLVHTVLLWGILTNTWPYVSHSNIYRDDKDVKTPEAADDAPAKFFVGETALQIDGEAPSMVKLLSTY